MASFACTCYAYLAWSVDPRAQLPTLEGVPRSNDAPRLVKDGAETRVSALLRIENMSSHVLGCESDPLSTIPDTGSLKQSLSRLHSLVMIPVAQPCCRQRKATMYGVFRPGCAFGEHFTGQALGEAEMKAMFRPRTPRAPHFLVRLQVPDDPHLLIARILYFLACHERPRRDATLGRGASGWAACRGHLPTAGSLIGRPGSQLGRRGVPPFPPFSAPKNIVTA